MSDILSFHFDLGESTKGPIGFCARVVADSPEAAVERLHGWIDAFQREISADISDDSRGEEYLTVYFNTDAVTVENIDEVDDADEEDD